VRTIDFRSSFSSNFCVSVVSQGKTRLNAWCHQNLRTLIRTNRSHCHFLSSSYHHFEHECKRVNVLLMRICTSYRIAQHNLRVTLDCHHPRSSKKKRERTRFLLLLSDFFCSLSNLTITSPLFYRCLTMSELMVMNMYIHTYISLCIYLCVCIEALS